MVVQYSLFFVRRLPDRETSWACIGRSSLWLIQLLPERFYRRIRVPCEMQLLQSSARAAKPWTLVGRSQRHDSLTIKGSLDMHMSRMVQAGARAETWD